MKLEGKIAIVTGASRGIGWEIALGFADEGADLVVCARDGARLERLVGEIERRGRRALAVKADVAVVPDVERLVEQTLAGFGRVDVLCNNAGVLHRGRVDELDPAQWDEMVAVNLRGPFLCSRAVLPYMKRQDYGRIVDMSSGSAINCTPGFSAYSASKAALNALSRTLANEVAGFNILVNAMSPGFLKTDMNPEGTRSPSAAVPTAVDLASLPDGGPNGRFYRFQQEMEVIPDLSNLDWTK